MKKQSLQSLAGLLALLSSAFFATSSFAANPANFDYSKIDLENIVILNSEKKNIFPYRIVDSEMRGYHPLEIALVKSLEEASESKMVSRLYVAKNPEPKFENIYVYIGQNPDKTYEFVRCYAVPESLETEDYGNYCDEFPIRDVMSWNMNVVNDEKKFLLIRKPDSSEIFRKN